MLDFVEILLIVGDSDSQDVSFADSVQPDLDEISLERIENFHFKRSRETSLSNVQRVHWIDFGVVFENLVLEHCSMALEFLLREDVEGLICHFEEYVHSDLAFVSVDLEHVYVSAFGHLVKLIIH